MNCNIKGKVKAVLPIQNGTSSKSGNAWQKQEFVIETEGQYPQTIAFSLFGDKVSQCPKVGDTVDVHFNLSSREYNGKWYHDIQAWKIDRPQTGQTSSPTAMLTSDEDQPF